MFNRYPIYLTTRAHQKPPPMRSSRLSRDTNRLMSVLASRARSTRSNPKLKTEEDDDDNAFSPSPTPDVPSDVDENTEHVQPGSKTVAKRKRQPTISNSNATAAAAASSSSAAAAARASAEPRVKEEALAPSEVATKPRAKKARRQPAKKVTSAGGEVKMEPPANWAEMYRLTREMRSGMIAPVDTMGCESLADRTRSERDQRLQTLVSLMLSSQTKDTVTSVAMRNLQEGIPGGFDLDGLLRVSSTELNGMINKVGFHNNKTKYIKQVAEILRDKFEGDIPDTIDGLVSLPGVGPKMAYLCMSAAWGRDEGIGVDVHVHRITNLWGWHKTKTPEETRAALEAWLPRDKWHDINNLLVGFGQMLCTPVGRKCGECLLSEKGLCPGAVVQKVVKPRVKSEKLEDDEETVVKQEDTDEIIQNIKAEDIADSSGIPDIEDIGTSNQRRRRPK